MVFDDMKMPGLEWKAWLRQQRRSAVDVSLKLVLIFGLLSLAVNGWRSIAGHAPATTLPVYSVTYMVLLMIYLGRGLSDRQRAFLLLLVCYLFGVYSLYVGWLAGGGRVFLVMAVAMSTVVLSDMRIGMAMAGLSLFTYAGFGFAFNKGWLVLGRLPDPTNGPVIFTEGVGFIIALGIVAASQWYFGQALSAAACANDSALRAYSLAEERACKLDAANKVIEHRTEQLEFANKELAAFSYSVSHDLRAPLRAIDGYSALLQNDCNGNLDAECRVYLEHVRFNVSQMNQLIDGLMRLARLTGVELHIQEVDLSAVAQRVIDNLRLAEPERRVDFHNTSGLVVQGDFYMLQAVLQNLLGNAWKFTGHHAQASIEFGVTEVDGRRTFYVRDDGAGFEMVYARKMFDPFQRLHSETEFPGTGIGLATVQRILLRHGGHIWAEGAVEMGATFYFELPNSSKI